MLLSESKRINEWRYNEYSDIGMDPGYDDRGRSGYYTQKFEYVNIPKLKTLSKELFGNADILIDAMNNDKYAPRQVNFHYNASRDEEDDFVLADEDYENYFANFEDEEISHVLVDMIEEELYVNHINIDSSVIYDNLHEICSAMQTAMNSSLDNLVGVPESIDADEE